MNDTPHDFDWREIKTLFFSYQKDSASIGQSDVLSLQSPRLALMLNVVGTAV